MVSEIFCFYKRAMETIQRITGQEDILHTNREESVDARSILIYILSSKGLSDMEISNLTGLTRQGVNKLKNGCKYRRKKWSFVSDLQQISNELATNCF